MKYKNLRDAFEQNVIKRDGCWGWKKSFSKAGYPRLYFRQGTFDAHRVSYELHVGPIAKGLYICHRCNNPNCSNPAHLYAGTQKQNMADSVLIGKRHNPKITDTDKLFIKHSSARQKDLANQFGISKSYVQKIQYS